MKRIILRGGILDGAFYEVEDDIAGLIFDIELKPLMAQTLGRSRETEIYSQTGKYEKGREVYEIDFAAMSEPGQYSMIM